MAEQQDYSETHFDSHAGNRASDERHEEYLAQFLGGFPLASGLPSPLTTDQLHQLEHSGDLSKLPRVRQKYQVVLAAYLREQQRPQQLKLMAKIFAWLQNTCWDSPLSPLWEASIALVEGLQDEGIEQTLSAANLLRSIDAQIRTFIEQGAVFANEPPNDALFRGLLYQVAVSTSQAEFTLALKARYPLQEALDQITKDLSISQESEQPVIEVLTQELSNIRDALEQYFLDTEPDPLLLQNQVPLIHQVGDTLKTLNWHKESQQIHDYARHLHELTEIGSNGEESGSVSSFMGITVGLKDLEDRLQQAEIEFTSDEAPSQAGWISAVVSTRETLGLSIRSLSKGIEHETEIDLELISDQINTACNTLGQTPLNDAAALVSQCNDIITEHWHRLPDRTPTVELLKPLNDVLTSVDYYLEQAQQASNTDLKADSLASILDIAQTHISILLDLSVDDTPLAVFQKALSDAQSQLATLLPQWQAEPDPEATVLKDIRHTFHSLKSTGRQADASVIGELAWSVENMLNRLIEGSVALSASMPHLLNRVGTMLPELMDAFSEGNQLLTADVLVCMEMADALANGEHYSAPEHPDDISEENEAEVVQFGEVISDTERLESHANETELAEAITPETPSHPPVTQLVHLFQADSYLNDWLLGVDRNVLGLLKEDLGTLASWANDQQVSPVLELCDVLVDICSYLEVYAGVLPSTLHHPMNEGFAALIEMIRLVAHQHTPDRPNHVFVELREALENLLQNQEQLHDVLIKHEADKERTKLSIDLAPVTDKRPEQTSEPIAPEPIAPEPSQPISVPSGVEVEETDSIYRFLDEAFEASEDAQQALEIWVTDFSNLEPVKELESLMGSLKNQARISEQQELMDLSRALEETYQRIFMSRSSLPDIPNVLLQASHDHIDLILQAVKDWQPVPSPDSYIAQLQHWGESHQDALDHQASQFEETDEPVPDTLPDYLANPYDTNQPGKVSVTELQTTALSEVPREDDKPSLESLLVTPEEAALQDSTQAPTAEAEQSAPIQVSTPVSRDLQPDPARIQVSAELYELIMSLSDESSINNSRIEHTMSGVRHQLDKIEKAMTRVTGQLHLLVAKSREQGVHSSSESGEPGEDVDNLNHVSHLSSDFLDAATTLNELRQTISQKSQETKTLLKEQSSTQLRLQDTLLRARMVSFDHLVPSLETAIAQHSEEFDKPVELIVDNSECEVDPTLLERVLPPLERLIRQVIRQGIESPEERKESGKPAISQLVLTVERKGSEILLILKDDGRIIHPDEVLSRAIENKLIIPEDKLSEPDIYQLLLEPGLYPAQSEVQRFELGAGLDVINTELRQLGGSLQVDCPDEAGCRYRLRLPYALSIKQALTVQANGSLYTFPLLSIDGVTTIEKETLSACLSEQKPLDYAGEPYQVLSLSQVLDGVERGEPALDKCPLILINRGGQKVALSVDALVEKGEVILKHLGPQFAALSGVDGATILGDGRVAVVINPVSFIRQYRVKLYYSDYFSYS